jgi:transketolase
VTQLFPEGHVIDLHPWEYNEVPVMLGAAFGLDVPIVALHLTRPPVEIPDREALGIPSHLAAARGAYVLRSYRPDQPRGGTVFVRGTMPIRNLVNVLPVLDAQGINVKVVAALSPQLFARQPASYRDSVASAAERVDAMVITNGAFKLMREWADGPLVREYSLSSDWDDQWRTGGSVAEVIEEAHLDEAHILAALERFAAARPERLRRMRELLDSLKRLERLKRLKRLKRQAHDQGIPEFAAGPPVLPDAAALFDEAVLAVQGDRGRVVREDLEAELVQSLVAGPVDGRMEQG